MLHLRKLCVGVNHLKLTPAFFTCIQVEDLKVYEKEKKKDRDK